MTDRFNNRKGTRQHKPKKGKMAYTDEQKKEIQINMFGMFSEQVDGEIIDQFRGDRLAYAMAVLSDAQEMMERGHGETARKFINKAKKAISDQQQYEWNLRMAAYEAK